MNEVDLIVGKLTEYFSHHSEICGALLFGSFAKGTYNSMSDVDIGIMYNNIKDCEDFDKWLTMKNELNLLLKKEIDLVILNKAEGIILSQILGANIKIKNTSSFYADLVMKNIYFHEDFLPIIRMNQTYKIKKVLHG
ncbi:MAG: nucleotidyltransferase domain-containing protein [Treponema sp.]|nr:nucleotidyltransferase domain-containing protein [Treponema sp.]